MALNQRAFSSSPINENGIPVSLYTLPNYVVDSGSIGSAIFSSDQINGEGIASDLRPKANADSILKIQQRTNRTEEGDLALVESIVNRSEAAGDFQLLPQTVGILGSGSVAEFWQTIDLRAAVDVPETIASFDQTITRSEASGSIFYLSQRVRDLSVSYRPFELDLSIGGRLVDPSEITGDIEITREEDSAALLTFSLLVPEGDVTAYVETQGKLVTLDYTNNATGKTDRLYTGKVDIPEIDFVQGVATYRCTDNRKEAINALDSAYVGGLGYYSEDVFGELPDELFDEVEDRLETIPYALDMNRFGGLKLTSWTPKTTADVTLTDADIYRRTPSVEVLSRGRVVNRVSIEMVFQYLRLRYREQPYLYSAPNNICNYFTTGAPVRKEMIHEALKSTSWAYKNMSMTDAACGSKQCYGSTIYRAPCGAYDGYYQTVTDADGNPVLDANGNPKQEFVSTGYVDQAKLKTNFATWTSYKRFAQNIDEKITVVVEAPQSIAQYGVVERRQTMGVSIDYDAEAFEDMSTNWDLSNFSTSSNGDKVLDLAYLVEANGAARWKAAYDCALERAKTTILKSHRDNTVTVETAIIPALELSDTVEISSSEWTSCKGKVGAIRHRITTDDREAVTEIEIKLSRSIGAPPTMITPNHEAARPQNRDDAPRTVDRIRLGQVVISKDEPISEDMVGAIYRQGAYNVLAAFAVNTPSIEDSRANREFEKTSTIELPIPNDSLTIRHKR